MNSHLGYDTKIAGYKVLPFNDWRRCFSRNDERTYVTGWYIPYLQIFPNSKLRVRNHSCTCIAAIESWKIVKSCPEFPVDNIQVTYFNVVIVVMVVIVKVDDIASADILQWLSVWLGHALSTGGEALKTSPEGRFIWLHPKVMTKNASFKSRKWNGLGNKGQHRDSREFPILGGQSSECSTSFRHRT